MIEIRLHGRGGQGTVIASEMLAYAFFLEGYYSQAFPSFGAERRGAPVEAFVRANSKEILLREPIQSPDYVIVASEKITKTIDVASGIKRRSLIIINTAKENKQYNFANRCIVKNINLDDISLMYNLGDRTMPIVNAPILGVFGNLTGLMHFESLKKAIEKFVPAKVNENLKALEYAFKLNLTRIQS